jgi:EmrB/QacA subfamily drug resistance transporter
MSGSPAGQLAVPSPQHATASAGRAGVLLTVCLGVGVATLNSTIANIALPQIGHSMRAGLTGLQWVANAYMVIYAALLLPAGRLADRMGRRTLFLAGASILTAGTACCAVAPGLGLLLAGRAVQAAGAAALVPATLALLPAEFGGWRRARAIGWWATAASAGMAAGPVAGGIMLAVAGWRSVFVLTVIVGAAAVALGRWLISPARHGRAALTGRAGSPDVVGAVAITIVLGACSFGLIEGQQAGWASAPVLAGFGAAAAALGAFAAAEQARARRGRQPLMPRGVWRIPRFTAASLGGLVYGLALFGLLFYLSLFLQQVQGRSALQAGLVFLPLTSTMAVTGPLAGWLTGRYGQRATAAAGAAVAAAGVLCLAVISPAESVASLAWRLALAGTGMGLMSTPLSSATIAALPEGSVGFASAMYNSSRQAGGVLGIALLGMLLAAGQAAARAAAAGPGLAFTHGLRLALVAAGLALAASASASALFLRGDTGTKRGRP